jgi:NADH dehydrogenase
MAMLGRPLTFPDSQASGAEPGLKELGIVPTAVEAIVPSYLWRFRKTGEFEIVAS